MVTEPATSRLTADDRIPVTLLTGFLGSGKTTVLNHLLRQPALALSAVVINEFGEIGLDHDLVAAATENIVLLQNGCLCCSIRGDLVETLHDLLERRLMGDIVPFERVLVETTGLADPTPILHTLMTDQVLQEQFRIDGIVVTVDAATATVTLDRHMESVKQVAVADLIVLTKTDMVAPDDLRTLETRLRTLNPSAAVVRAYNGAIDPARILGAGHFDASGKWGQEPAPQSAEGSPPNHLARIRSESLRLDRPISLSVLDTWLDTLMALKGPELLRVKGLIAVEGMPGPMLIHGVQHIFHPPVPLQSWPSEDHSTRLVIIHADTAPNLVKNSLAFLRSTAI